jgi:polyisoprenyl-phosphate glycosyltransferase
MARTVSVVVPVFQNEANLRETVPRLLGLRGLLSDYALELVFVDDGSRDRSLSILREFSRRHPEVIRIVKLTRNFGQTPAIQAGLSKARGDCVGIISADLQEPWELLASMVKEWERGARFVIGERQARSESRVHQLLSSGYWRLIRRFAFRDFPPLGYDFCLLDRQVVDDINRLNEKNSSIFALIYWLGYTPVRLPIVRRLREGGASQWGLARKIGFTLDTLIGFTYLPARVITIMSFTLGTLSLLYLAFAVALWSWRRAAPPGWMTEVGLLAVLGAMVLFALGIVSEYLVRLLDEVRRRPPYVVERVIGQDDEGASDAARPASISGTLKSSRTPDH